MSRLDHRITRLEDRAVNGPGLLAPVFTTEDGLHVSAAMPGMGTLHRDQNETNTAFEQRVFFEISKAASKGAIKRAQLSEETLKACLAALPVTVDALDNPMVRGWYETASGQEEGPQH